MEVSNVGPWPQVTGVKLVDRFNVNSANLYIFVACTLPRVKSFVDTISKENFLSFQFADTGGGINY